MGTATKATYTLRALAHLLRYPDEALRVHLPELAAALHAEGALSRVRLVELDALISRLSTAPPLHAEAEYVEIFDRGRQTALHLFEHVHGDSRDRGPAMLDLARSYAQAGLHLAEGELPDYLPAVLEFASTQPPDSAREFLRETAHILQALLAALLARASGYASVLAAVLDLAGERAAPVVLPPEPPLDESWAEPEAFAGCTSRGQSRGTERPVQFVRRTPSPALPQTSGAPSR